MMTSNSSVSTALEAIREGANDYIKKPFALDAVWKVVQRAIEKRSLKLANQAVMADGRAALALLDSEEFDLVITDLSMEGLSGLDVARGVKAEDPTLPVILLSGWAVQQSEQRVLEAGVDLVLPKPCSIDELLKAVQQTVRVPAAV